MHEHAGLAAARTGNHQTVAERCSHGFPLGLVQIVENVCDVHAVFRGGFLSSFGGPGFKDEPGSVQGPKAYPIGGASTSAVVPCSISSLNDRTF